MKARRPGAVVMAARVRMPPPFTSPSDVVDSDPVQSAPHPMVPL